jgi:hypothetical protein
MKLLQNVRELVLDRARAFKLRFIQSKHPIWGVMRTNVGLSPHFPGYMHLIQGVYAEHVSISSSYTGK